MESIKSSHRHKCSEYRNRLLGVAEKVKNEWGRKKKDEKGMLKMLSAL